MAIAPFYTIWSGVMASIARRGESWRASVARRGRRVTRTFDTKAEAHAWAIGLENELLNKEPVPQAANSSPTVESLFTRYANTVSPGKGGEKWEIVRLAALSKAPIFLRPVSDLTPEALADWRDSRLGVVRPSTVNRDLNLISAVLNHARKEWRVSGLSPNPVHEIQRPRDPQARTRRIPKAERDRITKQMKWDGKKQPVSMEQWIAWSFCLALETAMRKGEILSLTWEHVHLAELRLHLPKTKNGYARDVPLSTQALALFDLVAAGKGPVVPVQSNTFDTLFRRAKVAVGLADLRFHDSRREATSRFAERLGLLELAAVTGHRSLDILRTTYYQPDATALAKKLG